MPRTRNTQKSKDKPTLIKVGKHYISPDDVNDFKCERVGFHTQRVGFYTLRPKSNSEEEHPLWVTEKELKKSTPILQRSRIARS